MEKYIIYLILMVVVFIATSLLLKMTEKDTSYNYREGYLKLIRKVSIIGFVIIATSYAYVIFK